MEDLRIREFRRLDDDGHVYLDYTGGGLYAESQIRRHAEMLTHTILGNPHSKNPSSLASTHNVEKARRRILEFFDAPDTYEVIFTSNASGALKLVGESYPFEAGGCYLLTTDNHNSVNGIREFAKAKGADISYIKLNDAMRVDEYVLMTHLRGADHAKNNLFAYPAQSNFSGVKHPLEWVAKAQQLGYDVLLDAAAFAPTNRLSLREISPEYVCISFYKMFGFPTGVGALIAKREALAKLHRPWFAGGTVKFVSAQNNVHYLQSTGEAFEDGTVNYISIAAIVTGLDFLGEIGMGDINGHVQRLTELMLAQLQDLRHSNGEPVIRLYGSSTTEMRGGTAAFNVLCSNGIELDVNIIEEKANQVNISVRTGCFCNPGAAEAAFHYDKVAAYQCFNDISPEAFTLQQFSDCMDGKPVGAVRASLGVASNEADVLRFIAFIRSFIDCEAPLLSGRQVPEIVSD